MSTRTPKIAIVTGASSGIGAATAKLLASRGYTVYGTSRKMGEPRSGPTGTIMRTVDVRDESTIDRLVDDVVRDAGHIDLLVNNAGATLVGALEETTLAEAKGLFDVNFFGAVRMTTAVAAPMREARRGRIVFVSSVLGLLPAPFMGMYAATKHALEGYAETLDHELRDFGVRSILVEPAFTATHLLTDQPEASQRLAAYASVRAGMLRKLADATANGVQPEAVAEVILEAASATVPNLRYPVGAAKSLSRLRRFVPERMFDTSFRRRFLLGA